MTAAYKILVGLIIVLVLAFGGGFLSLRADIWGTSERLPDTVVTVPADATNPSHKESSLPNVTLTETKSETKPIPKETSPSVNPDPDPKPEPGPTITKPDPAPAVKYDGATSSAGIASGADFSVQTPPTWTKQVKVDAKGNPQILLMSPEFSEGSDGAGLKGSFATLGYEGSWTASGDPKTMTPQQYVDTKLAHYAQFGDKVIQKQVTLGGIPAHFRRNTVVGGQIASVYTIHNQKEFNIRYIPAGGNWTTSDEFAMSEIIATFIFTN